MILNMEHDDFSHNIESDISDEHEESEEHFIRLRTIKVSCYL